MIAGDSIKAIAATMCPDQEIARSSRKLVAVMNVTALIEPKVAAIPAASASTTSVTFLPLMGRAL